MFFFFYRLSVFVDDVLETSPNSNVDIDKLSIDSNAVYLGGTSESSGIGYLTGCLNNVFFKVKGEPERYKQVIHILF